MQLVFVTALNLNYSFYRSRIVPRFISIWGLLGAPLAVATALRGMCSAVSYSSTAIVPFLPIAVNEMVLSVWLIVKGFDQSAIVSSPRGE
jgi:hypothetical protein